MSTCVHPRVFGGVRVAHMLSFFMLSYYVSLLSYFRVVISVTISALKRYSVRLSLQLFVRGLMLFALFVFVCIQWCPIHIVLCLCFVFLRLVYPILPVSLDCLFLIASSVVSNVYLPGIFYPNNYRSRIINGFFLMTKLYKK